MTPIPPKDRPISVVVPARNEAATIARVITTLRALPLIDEVVVVDNGSTDDTAAVAKEAGAQVITEARPGMGHAIRAGFIAARHDWVMKVDADLDRFDMSRFASMIKARAPGVGLVKGQWQDARDPMPMTRYLVKPALRQMFPALGQLEAPNSGIYLFDRSWIALPEIVGHYAADLDVMIRVHAAGAGVTEVDIGRIENDLRDADHYSAMSDTIMGFFLWCRDAGITDDIVVMAETAEQVIKTALGTLATHARNGGTVTICLASDDTPEATVLRDAVAAFPTVKVMGLSALEAGFVSHAATGLRLIVPFGMDALHRDAIDFAKPFMATHAPRILMMPPAAQADGFAADMGFDVTRGRPVKSEALDRIGAGDVSVPPREVFQTLTF